MNILSAKILGLNFNFSIERMMEIDQVSKNNEFLVGFHDWEKAKSYSAGYDHEEILIKAVNAARMVRDGLASYERDTVLFYDKKINHILMAWFQYVGLKNDCRLSVLDYGGSFGSGYYQHKALLGSMKSFHWGVVEQPQFVSIGRKEFSNSELTFHDSIKECAEAIRPNVLLISSVLQYLENPWNTLTELLNTSVNFVLIDRTMAHRKGNDFIAVQEVPESIYSASYPVWMLNAKRLEDIFLECGYEIVDCFDPFPGTQFGPNEITSPYIGWFLKRLTI